MKINLLEPGELVHDRDHTVAAMVAVSDGDTFRIQEGEECVKGTEARRIGQSWAIENVGEDGFEASGVWSGIPRIYMCFLRPRLGIVS